MIRRIRQHHGATFRQGHRAIRRVAALEFARVNRPTPVTYIGLLTTSTRSISLSSISTRTAARGT